MVFEHEGARRAHEGKTKILHGELSRRIVSCAMHVHSALGPGLLEAAYEECLCHELAKAGLPFRRQVPVPLVYDGLRLDCGFRLDILVDESVVLEIKATERVIGLHEAQLFTYLRLTGMELGMILNFNVRHMRDGVHRRVLTPGDKQLLRAPSCAFVVDPPPANPGT